MSDRSEIEWAPRVSLRKIRELYRKEAGGILEDELLEEVGFGLYARCQSILEFSEAKEGRVRCKRCQRAGRDSWITRHDIRGNELLCCPACGWEVRWRVYLAESKKVDGQLDAGNARAAFLRYAACYPLCATREEKILAIDRLIHEFHWILIEDDKEAKAWKPAGVNLLRGSTTQVIEMLNELTYGEHTPDELFERRDWWRKQHPIARRNLSS